MGKNSSLFLLGIRQNMAQLSLNIVKLITVPNVALKCYDSPGYEIDKQNEFSDMFGTVKNVSGVILMIDLPLRVPAKNILSEIHHWILVKQFLEERNIQFKIFYSIDNR